METLQGIPGMSAMSRAFIQMTRNYLRDFPELNRLTAGVENTDRQIAWAILDALSDFNGTPPFLGTTSLEGMLGMNQQALLLRMTCCSLIESVGLLQTRNQINYTNGNITVGINDKTPQLMGWLQKFQSTTEQMKLKVKVAMNIGAMFNSAYSGVHSEYWSTNQSYASFGY